jgi:26S proteasome regulatory subunit N10
LLFIFLFQLALKHRQGKNHKPRIVIFIGSPLQVDKNEFFKLAKRLKKEKVNVDLINFGEEEANRELLDEFVNTLNGKDGTGSHLVSISAPSSLADALLTSTVVQGEDGSGLPAGFGPGYQYSMEDDPELAMALRISMEEQRMKQEADAKKTEGSSEKMDTDTGKGASSDDALMQQALAMSLGQEYKPATTLPDFSSMTEEEQLNYALQMSIAQAQGDSQPGVTGASMDTDMKEVGF